jgi:tetratricopeptide (TPR) repeat protein
LARCRQQTTQQTSDEQRAAVAFELVQAQWLTGPYDSNCARLQRTLEDGTYNCLMATLLYLATCRDAGLTAVPLAAPGHVAVRVWWDSVPHDVETTDRRWLPQPVELGSVRGQQISDRALLARVYYNLGIQLAREGDFVRALHTTRQSCRLDPTHAEARANLLAVLNNWSIELVRQGQYAQAEALIQEGLRLDDQYEPLHRSAAFVRDRQSAAASP